MRKNTNSMIQQLPSEAKICDLVERFLDLGNINESARCFCQVILAVANADAGDGSQYNLALAAARQAYRMTTDYEESFREFAGFPGLESSQSETSVTEVFREQ